MVPEERSLPAFPVQVEAFVLTNVSFQRADTIPEGERQLKGQVGLTAHEGEDDDKRYVELTVVMDDEDVFHASVGYTVVLRRVGEFSELDSIDGETAEEEAWNLVVQKVVPMIAYPYARETLTTLFQKADLPVNIPPVVDWGKATITPAEDPPNQG